jgi:hypothetical protein
MATPQASAPPPPTQPTVTYEPLSYQPPSYVPLSNEAPSDEPLSHEPPSYEPPSYEPLSNERGSYEPPSSGALVSEPAAWRGVEVDLPAGSLPVAGAPPAQWAPPGETGAWAPVPPPPPQPAGRHVLVKILSAGLAVVGFVGGAVAWGLISDGDPVPFTNVEESLADDAAVPVDYQGPTFTVRLPGSPAVDVGSENGFTLTTYIAEVGDGATGVAVMDLQPGDSFNLELGVQGVVDSIGGTIVSNTAVEVGGLPGRDYQVANAEDGRATTWGRFIVADSKVYQIMTVREGDAVEPPAEHVTALETFAIR